MRWNRSSMENFCVSCLICGMRILPQGEAMNIRMFSNLAQMAAGYPAEECGMNGCCNCYFVVEGDGSVYPCDFYCMDEWKLGTVNDGFVQMKTSEKAKAFVEASRPVCATCQ